MPTPKPCLELAYLRGSDTPLSCEILARIDFHWGREGNQSLQQLHHVSWMKEKQRGNKSYGILNYPLTCSKPATRPVRREKQKNWMSGCILLADTRPWGIYQLFFFSFFFFDTGELETGGEQKRGGELSEEGERERERQTRLIVMLNLRVSDTITMPTPLLLPWKPALLHRQFRAKPTPPHDHHLAQV